ncbi:hypothetical protein DQ384_16185 [Sphaerisporangium album]|uniref:Uncharacterized protein n=1 Tax=Sphaerisporangium album TaxID=509200 RepID=A0A367FIR8_9ACTN|nr:hypothetical protein [Sphaerisporangium album]RCG30278.1 hypothetical protein DQ384_16185 [Sphaerisporangium album]
MTNEIADNTAGTDTANTTAAGKAAARALAARLPGWTVWYGEHTRRFWAMPRSAVPAGTRMPEADTIEELEAAVHRMQGTAPRAEGNPGSRQEPPAQDPLRAAPGHMDPQQQLRRQPVGANG